MSMLSELLNKEEKLKSKIQKESNRMEAVEDKKLSELKSAFDDKAKQLNKWYSDVKNYLVDKPAVERFNALMNQYATERATYQIERLVGKVSKEYLARIEPKSMSTLISLYKLQGFFESLSDCAKPATSTITQSDVTRAKQEYETLKKKIADRRTQ